MTDSDIPEKIQQWDTRVQSIEILDNWFGVFGCLATLIASVYTLFVILAIHKQYEKFLIGTTVSFGLNGLFGIPFYAFTIYSG